MSELISIVVPIYNVDKYLDKCISSIINQTYSNIEIILVNDGSTDDSEKICMKYKDDRIKYVKKENGGLSDARNYGINVATGAYITFIDSDDYVESDYVQFLYEILKNTKSDIAICNPKYVYEGLNKEKNIYPFNKTKLKKVNNLEGLEIMMYQKKFDTSAWGKLYKINLFDDIIFPKGKLYEDLATIYKVFLKANKIVFSNEMKYFYLQRSTSIMGQKFRKKEMDLIENANEMLLKLSNINDDIKKSAISRFISANFSIYRKIDDKKLYKE